MTEAAKDPEAAEKQAETDGLALKAAKTNQATLIAGRASPEQISVGERALDIAQEKAELSATNNADAQRKSNEQRSAILEQAQNELTRLEQDRSPSAGAMVHAALQRVDRASDDAAASRRSFDRAEEMLHEVAGILKRPDPSTGAATEHYPDLVIAKGRLHRAQDRLAQGERKDIKPHLAQVQKAASEEVGAWERARNDAGKGHDARLRAACDVGLARARENLDILTSPQYVEAREKESRQQP